MPTTFSPRSHLADLPPYTPVQPFEVLAAIAERSNCSAHPPGNQFPG